MPLIQWIMQNGGFRPLPFIPGSMPPPAPPVPPPVWPGERQEAPPDGDSDAAPRPLQQQPAPDGASPGAKWPVTD